jgi:hypothetical protein
MLKPKDTIAVNRADFMKLIKAARHTLEDARMALRGTWDRSNDGFEAQRDSVAAALTPFEQYLDSPLFPVMSFDEFEEKYTLVKNPFAPDGSFDGCLFEADGEELQCARGYPEEQIWTYIEADDKHYVIAGYHLVNRIGYLVTEEPWGDSSEEYVLESE